ncbi:Zn(2)-C6 fungal-type domain-containing protein [Fusarium keratoplasticum]|uniref:Zn(2)-C6 fungal-type domain-containing protein n=1 Tax=Fusarium keratoplasticum TaxID=1328300 RepID=A0ACC0QIM5_9HYPO|nr:Zn(2)-C6 fungal-type domain-containing protein [Fusarium keratoplasticum]KAI8652574.1 Zn(2)-C6 fungal-type domain-containing protein [Fusarium keratoplasticum]
MNASTEARYLLLGDQRPHKIPRIEPAAPAIHPPWPSGDSQIQHNDYQHSSRRGAEDEVPDARPTAASLPAGTGQPPRTRGTVACRKCRSRKTKCDNQRPSCGYCLKIGEPCVYEAEASSCCHVFGREVLQALNELREIVSKPPNERLPVDNLEVTTSNREDVSPSSGPVSVVTSTPQPATPSSHLRLRPASASLRWTQKIENIIQWRIFQSHIVASDIYPDADLPVTLDHSMPSTDRRLLTDLESRYIHSVHLFNPILHLPTLHDLILRVAESQFDWSPETCLVALVCAIGAMTEPLDTSQTPEASSVVNPDESRNRSDPILAIRYWNVASKRLGLVLDRNDITAVQCLCLAGIWHMLNLQPLQAWKYFSHAGNAWFCTVMRNGPLPKHPERTHFGPICVQDALCFTIWKSICELHPELSLPPSVLQDCEVLRPFPTLPDLDDPRLDDPLINSERSWLYYLAEIAARHLINDLLECHVYDFDNLQRADVVRMIRHTEIFEAQIDEWRSSLPAQLQFDVTTDWTLPELDHPMTMVLRQRYLSSLELTYRPLLRLCTDFSLEDFQGYEAPLLSSVVKLASQNLRFSYLKILNTSKSLHQGTWFNLRSLTGSCLRFAAVEKAQRDGKLAGAQEVRIPPDWRSCVMKGIETLQPYWASKRGGGAGLMDLMDQALAM